MSETLLAVIIGGLIGAPVPVLTIIYYNKRWKKEKIISHLREKKKNLITHFETAKDKLIEGMEKNSYDIDMMSDFDFIFPETVSKAFEELMSDKEKHVDKIKFKFHYYTILRAMKSSLSEIDRQIEDEIRN